LRLNSCKLETGSKRDKTQFTPHFETGQNCLVLSPVQFQRQHGQDKTRQFCLVRVGVVNYRHRLSVSAGSTLLEICSQSGIVGWLGLYVHGFQVARYRRRRTFYGEILSSSAFFFFIRPLLSELPERTSTKTGHTLGRECDLKVHVKESGASIAPKNWGSKTHSQLNGNFNGRYLTERNTYIQPGKCVGN